MMARAPALALPTMRSIWVVDGPNPPRIPTCSRAFCTAKAFLDSGTTEENEEGIMRAQAWKPLVSNLLDARRHDAGRDRIPAREIVCARKVVPDPDAGPRRPRADTASPASSGADDYVPKAVEPPASSRCALPIS